MNGDIKLYSEVGKGSSFVFYVPIDNNERNRAAASGPTNLHNVVNVMVVDDYAHNRDLHKLLLQREGAQVLAASDGKEAFEKYKQYEEGHFAFIMMDVLMPDMDGFETAKIIRNWDIEQNRKKKVDICFVSGEYYNEQEVMSAFRLVGGRDANFGIKCMKKPVDIEAVKNMVESYKVQAEGQHANNVS